MNSFNYLSPKTIEQAISLSGQYGEKAKFIAGGTDIVVKLKKGEIKPEYLISLRKIKELTKFFKDYKTGELVISAMVTHASLEKSLIIQNKYPIIYDAVSNIGSLQVRNIGTIGGNLINAVPSADGAIPLIALDGIAVLYGSNGERFVKIKDLFVAPYKTILKPDEILKKIIIPKQAQNTGSAYIKFGRRAAMELPLVGIGVLLILDNDLKTCLKARIALGVAGPVRDSIRGKAWYRKEIIQVQVKRMGLKCLEIINNNYC
ncbi:MAG: hypothetical protein B6I26_06025 [Desulfobacteraceae bacterium 4572_130]|nr:MAG: hypothetical protein B6I26_06025 [Desulfobacteraceae bacterium 4572_130]